MIHEYAVELAGQRLGKQRRAYGGIHAAGKGKQHMCIAHLLFDVRDELLLKVLQVVVSLCAANRVKKAAYHCGSIGRAFNLGVELEAIELFSGIFYCRILAGDGVSN